MADTTYLTYDHTNIGEIEHLLLGRRIVQAEKGDFPLEGRTPTWYNENPSGKLTLDDGTQIYVTPHIGGCSCGAGDYELTSLASVDNVITSVRVVAEEPENIEEYCGEPPTSYRIYVVADNQEINAMQIDGNDGNGWYGTGYELIVVPARQLTLTVTSDTEQHGHIMGALNRVGLIESLVELVHYMDSSQRPDQWATSAENWLVEHGFISAPEGGED